MRANTHPGESSGFRIGPVLGSYDLERQTAQRLSIVAHAIAGIILVNLFIYTGLPLLGGPEFGEPAGWIDLALLLLAVFCVVFGILVRRLENRPQLAMDLGLGFEILVGWSTAFILRGLSGRLWIPVDGISDLCILILLFPMLVPNAPWKTLLASVIVATADPVAVKVVGLELGRDATGAQLFEAFHWNYLCAALSVLPAVVLRRLSREVKEAQRLGAYRLKEKLGQGGMGEVWAARHALLARAAAVKIIRPESLRTGSERAGAVLLRFEREARATARLQSPHSIQLFDYGRSEGGEFYYVMELLEGLDLETLVQRYGPLPAPRVCHLLRQACHSLQDAHERGLIHRDIKPANLFTCRLGQDHDFLKVLDFGLVRGELPGGGADIRVTAENEVPGTPATLAPEVARGTPTPDHRSDLYSLGCVAYWLLTGQLVFTGDTPMQVLLRHIGEPPTPPSRRSEVEIPADLERVVLDCLAKDPDARPASAAALAERLELCECSGKWGEREARRWWSDHRPTRELKRWIESDDALG